MAAVVKIDPFLTCTKTSADRRAVALRPRLGEDVALVGLRDLVVAGGGGGRVGRINVGQQLALRDTDEGALGLAEVEPVVHRSLCG